DRVPQANDCSPQGNQGEVARRGGVERRGPDVVEGAQILVTPAVQQIPFEAAQVLRLAGRGLVLLQQAENLAHLRLPPGPLGQGPGGRGRGGPAPPRGWRPPGRPPARPGPGP